MPFSQSVQKIQSIYAGVWKKPCATKIRVLLVVAYLPLGGNLGVTAQKEGLRLLATLPLELEVVKEGDAGDISLLDNKALLITQEFNKMVDKIVKLTDRKTYSSDHSDKDYAGRQSRTG